LSEHLRVRIAFLGFLATVTLISGLFGR